MGQIRKFMGKTMQQLKILIKLLTDKNLLIKVVLCIPLSKTNGLDLSDNC